MHRQSARLFVPYTAGDDCAVHKDTAFLSPARRHEHAPDRTIAVGAVWGAGLGVFGFHHAGVGYQRLGVGALVWFALDDGGGWLCAVVAGAVVGWMVLAVDADRKAKLLRPGDERGSGRPMGSSG